MPYTVLNSVGGAQTNSGLTPAAIAYIEQEYARAQALRTQMRTDVRTASTYKAVENRIETSIAAWRTKFGYSASDDNTYYTGGLPYKKNGDILIVVTDDTFPLFDSAGNQISNDKTPSPYFDERYNRVVLTKSFMEAVSVGSVQILRYGGNTGVETDWVSMTLADVINHEPGHRVESLDNFDATINGPLYADGVVDVDAERLGYMTSLLEGGGIYAQHGYAINAATGKPEMVLRIKGADGEWHRITKDNADTYWPHIVGNGSSLHATVDARGNISVVDDITGISRPLSPLAGQVGSLIGSSLGQLIAHDGGTIAQIAASTVLGSIGQSFGNALNLYGHGIDLSQSFDVSFAQFDQNLFNNLKSAGIGAISAFTTMELGNALGLHGFGAELFNAVAGSATAPVYNAVLNNIVAGHGVFDGFNLSSVFGSNPSLDSVFGPSIGAFFGSQLGSLVISPTTTAGAVLSSLGSSIGTLIATKVLGSLGNIIAPGIGAFVGFVLGAFIGNLFGHHKPRIPSAMAETALQLPYSHFAIAQESSANGGDLAFADNMAAAARDTLNGLIYEIAGANEARYVANVTTLGQVYGYSGSQIYVKFDGVQHNVSAADEAVSMGVMWALPQLQLIGGDMFLKRALINSHATDVPSLLGDLQAAGDYSNYLRNRDQINSLIAADPTSPFAAAWIVTLGRVVELGLNTFARSDFYGGLQGFLQTFEVAGAGKPVNYEDITVSLSAGALTITGAGPAAVGLFSLLPIASNDGTSISIASFGTQVGYVEQSVGIRSTANDVEIAVPGSGAVTVSAGTPGYSSGYYGYYAGNDGGSDIIIGASGNDYLAAGSGGDWIDGQAGDDQIYGGAGADVLLGGDGNDQITGATGRQYLAGGNGDDYLDGGTGADVLVGGAGSDTVHGGDGNDILIADEDGGGIYDVLDGGNGNDTVSFERFSSGVTADISGQGPSNALTVVQAGYEFYRNTSILSPDGNYRFTFQDNQDVVLYGPGSAILWASNTQNNGANRLVLNPDGNLVLYDGGVVKWQSYSGGHSGATLVLDNAGQININDQDGTAYWTVGGGGYIAPVTSNIYGDEWVSIENVTGSKYGDSLIGTNYGSTLKGLAGNDVLTGGLGDDVIEGGDGSDQISGGGGNNTASYSASQAGVYVNLASGIAIGGDASGDMFSNVQNISGSNYSDELAGDANVNTIKAGAGNDWIDATGGGDTYDGGDGFDTVDYSATNFVESTYNYDYGGIHYEGTFPAIMVTLGNISGSVLYGDPDSPGLPHTLGSIEQVIGTSLSDAFSSSGSTLNVTWNGGAGADTFSGGDGSDIYVFGHGFGIYTIADTVAGSNTLRFASDVTFDDLWVGNSGGTLQIGIRGESGYMSVASNFAVTGNDVIKTLDIGGVGHVDLTQISAVYAGSDGAESIAGDSSTANLIFAYNGNDTIYAANNVYSYQGSVIHAGLGDDTVVTSVGDDQFLFERGNGHDYVIDGGGQNTIVFGSTVSSEDVIYQVVGNDLIVGIRNLDNPGLAAGQVADTIQIVGGAVKNVGTVNGTTYWNTSFSVEAGGATTDLTKANIAWAVNYYDDSTPPGGYGGYGGYGGGYIPPIILDLNNDGLEITPVAQSNIVTTDAAGNVLRTSWVGPTNGILAYDRNGDGRVDNTGDISFRQDKEGARTDLQGLSSWDSNGDGVLDGYDANFAKLVVWTDTNQDGRQEPGEVVSLLAVGVASIDLKGKATGFDGKDNVDTIVHNTTFFTRTDGSTGAAYDVALARRALSDGAASSILGSKGLAGVATFGTLTADPQATAQGKDTASTAGMLATLTGLDVGDTVPKTLDAAAAARWANVVDPTLRAARQALLSGGMQGADLLQAIRTSVAHGDDWTALFGRGLRTAATRMQAVVIDFDQSGADLIDPAKSLVLADVSHAGVPVQVGWVKGVDGVLAYDADRNGTVDVEKEVDFTGKVANGKSAFQGMGAYDTNRDGLLNAADTGFANFLIWRDKNANGRSDVGEVQSLAQAGVKQFDLARQSSRSAFGSADANEVLGVGKVTFTDGSSRATYDVALGFADGDTNADPAPTRTPASKTTIIGASPSDSANEAGTNGRASSPDLSTSAGFAMVERMRGGLSGQSGQVVAADAAPATASQWWRDSTAGGRDLASLASPQLVGNGRSGANASSLAGTPPSDAAQLQRIMLLRQNMAAMHGDAGGAAAIWNRGAANDMPLAAASTSGYATLPASTFTARAG